jgi:hypothetical protein
LASICKAESRRIVPNRKKRNGLGILPARNTPVRAPAVVAVSNTIARRTLVKRSFKNAAALPQEQAMTETMLAPMASLRSTWHSMVKIGTIKIPLAIPSMPPKHWL